MTPPPVTARWIRDWTFDDRAQFWTRAKAGEVRAGDNKASAMVAGLAFMAWDFR